MSRSLISNVQRNSLKFELGVIHQIFDVGGRFSVFMTQSNQFFMLFLDYVEHLGHFVVGCTRESNIPTMPQPRLGLDT